MIRVELTFGGLLGDFLHRLSELSINRLRLRVAAVVFTPANGALKMKAYSCWSGLLLARVELGQDSGGAAPVIITLLLAVCSTLDLLGFFTNKSEGLSTTCLSGPVKTLAILLMMERNYGTILYPPARGRSV